MVEGNLEPQEVCLLNFAMVEVGHPTCDLMHFLFPCVETERRVPNTDSYLQQYFITCSRICSEKQSTKMYSLDDLKNEYNDKQLFGLIIALCLVPPNLSKTLKYPDNSKMFSPKEREGELAKYRKQVCELVADSKQEKALLSIFDALKEDGFFERSSES